MISLVRKTLDIYLREKRVITQSDFPADIADYLGKKDAVFVTLYHEGHVVASSGRIACQKDNSVFECIDNTLQCLKDPRFSVSLQYPEILPKIYIRVDIINSTDRRVVQSIEGIDTSREGIIFLSQNLGAMSIILPHMLHVDPKPAAYFELACKKAGLDPAKLKPSDYVLYAVKTTELTDMV